MKTTVKRALSVLFVLSLMLTLLLPALAAPAEAAGGKAVSTIWVVSPEKAKLKDYYGIVLDAGEKVLVITDEDFVKSYDGNQFWLALEGKSGINMTYKGPLSDKLCVFECPKVSFTGALSTATAVNGKTVFYSMEIGDDSVYEKSSSATINGGKETSSGVFTLDVTKDQDAGGVTYKPTGNYLVGALLDGSGNLVAIYAPNGNFVTYKDLGGYSGSGSTPPTTDPHPTESPAPKPTSGSDPAGRDDPDPTSVSPTAPGPNGTGNNGGISWTVVAIVGAVAVALVAVVAVVIVLKKKGGNNGGGNGGYYPPTVPEIQPQPPVVQPPVQPPVYVPPVVQPPVQSSAMFLYGVGGVMNGRRYQISTNEITFGRELDNVISFPADTKGVSRHHCKLFWHKGALMIMDLGSTYGTFFHGKGQIPANKPFPIHVGDTFYLGEKKNGFTIREN